MRKSVGLFFLAVAFAATSWAQTFPSVSVVASDPVATEPGPVPMDFVDTGTFTISRDGSTNLPLMVFFTLSGTASNGLDYAKLESPVTIPEGERAVRVMVVPLHDDLVEGEERVLMRIAPSPLAGPGSGYILPTNSLGATVVIRDSNQPPPTNVPPNVNITRPANGAIFSAPADINIVAETVDPDGWVPKVEFFANSNKIGESVITFIIAPEPGTPITHEFRWNGVPAGQYTLSARATDDRGATRLSVPVRISVTDSNEPPPNMVPVVEWLRPTNGARFLIGSTIILSARATDSDGTVGRVEFYANSNRVGTVTGVSTNSVYNFAWSNAPAGNFRLHAEAVDNAGGRGASDSVQIAVGDGGTTNGPPRTVVTIVATDPEGSEIPEVPPGMGMPQRYDPAVFTVARTGILSNALTVLYSIGGAALNGVDYARIPNEVTIPAGETSARIEISVIDDQLVEGTETVAITIQPPVCVAIFPPPPGCYLVGVPGSAVARILDNDIKTNEPPRTVVSIVVTDAEGSEIPEVPPGMDRPQLYDPAVFTVTRTGPVSNALVVSYMVGGTAQNGVDYVALPGHVEIPAGARSANIEVSVIDDLLVEGTETVTIRLIPPPCIAIYPPPPECYVVGVPGEARLLTFDDVFLDEEYVHVPPGYGGLDWYNFLVYDGSSRPANEGYHTGTVSPRNVAFNGHGDPASIRGRDGSFDLKSAYLTAALNLDENLNIRVQGIRENAIVYDNTYVVNRTGPTLAQFDYTGITEARFITSPPIQFAMDNLTVAVSTPSRAEARILDNDFAPSNQPPTVAIISPSSGAQFKAPANIPITATTFDHDGYTTRVEFYANDFKIGEARKEFLVPPPPGESIQFDFEWKDARAGLYSLTARAIDDRGGLGVSRPVQISVLGTNLPPNTNMSTVSITAPDANASEHGTNIALFVIRREGNTNAPVQVFYATQGTASNGVDYLEIPGSVIIPRGERSARIVVTPINDQIPEPMESVVIALLPPPVMNSFPQYSVGSPARAAAVIADDDGPRPPIICLRDGVLEWCRPATNGQCFRIECSTDLVTWTELCTAQAADNAVHYADAEAPAIRMRFYRAVPIPCPEPQP